MQNLTLAHGPGMSRFDYDDEEHNAKHVPLGDLVYLDRERCIQCARCMRFQDEVADDQVLQFFERGRNMEIVTFSDPPFDSYFGGNTTDICPVGALTTADFRFKARPWELDSTQSRVHALLGGLQHFAEHAAGNKDRRLRDQACDAAPERAGERDLVVRQGSLRTSLHAGCKTA